MNYSNAREHATAILRSCLEGRISFEEAIQQLPADDELLATVCNLAFEPDWQRPETRNEDYVRIAIAAIENGWDADHFGRILESGEVSDSD